MEASDERTVKRMRNRHGGNIYDHEGFLDFSSNINPFPVPEQIRKAGKEALNRMNCYPDPECLLLRKEIAKKVSQNGLQLQEHYILCGNGAADLIYSLCSAIMPKEALLVAPSFSEYELALHFCHTRIRYYNLKEEYDFQVQEDLLESIHEKLSVLFLTVPNNPTGKLIEPELLQRIIKRCVEYNIYCVIDESFLDFTDEESSVYRTFQDHHQRQLVCYLRSFTKMYAMAGVRLGFLISGNETLLERIRESRQPWGVSLIAQEMGLAALSQEGFVTDTRKRIAEERMFLQESMKKLGIRVVPSEANFIFFQTEEDFAEKLMEENILVRDCSNFSGLTKGWFRVAVRTQEENRRLIEAMERQRQ